MRKQRGKDIHLKTTAHVSNDFVLSSHTYDLILMCYVCLLISNDRFIGRDNIRFKRIVAFI